MRFVDPLIPFTVAVIVVVPWLVLFANPESFTAATVGAEELQTTPDKTSVLPSLKLPVAVNC